MREVYILGLGMHKFGRFPDKTIEQLGMEAINDSLTDAGIKFKDIQAAFCGTVFGGWGLGHRISSKFGLQGIPIVNVEAACASGGSAFNLSHLSVASGQCDVALAFGVEKMPRGFIAGQPEDWYTYTGLSVNPVYFALKIKRHMEKYGGTEDHLIEVSVKNHRNGVLNPYAMYQKETPYEVVKESHMVNDPLRLLMLCAPNEGAAAVILCSKEVIKKFNVTKPVQVAASVLKTAVYGTPEVPHFSISANVDNPPPAKLASREAYEIAGVGPEDLDLIELQDTDSGSEIIAYEELGLCNRGEGYSLLDKKMTEPTGKMPVNVSGGLLCKGEPLGASALGQIVELGWQLRGETGHRQVENAKVGLAHVYGAHGNCSVTILKS